MLVVFFQAEDGIRDLVRSRGLGDVYKRQVEVRSLDIARPVLGGVDVREVRREDGVACLVIVAVSYTHLTLPTSDLV